MIRGAKFIMDERLVKAAREGNVNTLLNLLEEDPQILQKASSLHFADSPLHVAALSGKTDFVKQLVSLLPSLATETNQQGMIPLHLASLEGHVETVRELLKAKLDDDGVLNHQCLVKDEEGWTPLHCASQKGKITVMEEFIRECPQSLEQVTAKGETVLHLAVKANQFGAVKLLAESLRHHRMNILFKIQDHEGKSSSQLAEAKKLFQVLEVLKEDDEKEGDEIREDHCIRLEGITTAYNLEAAKKTSLVRQDEGKEEEKKDEIKEQTSINVGEVEDGDPEHCDERKEEEKKDNIKKQTSKSAGDDPYRYEARLLVATLIITLTYQGLANPPSTLFQPGKEINWRCLPKFSSLGFVPFHVAIKRLESCPAYLALLFLVYNTTIFTLSICLLLSSVEARSRALVVYSLQFLAIFLVINYCVLLQAITARAVYATLPVTLLCYVFSFCVVLKRTYENTRGKKKEVKSEFSK